jgi:hypothetical protein
MFNFLEYVTGGKGYLIREAVRLSHPYPVPGTVNKVSVVLTCSEPGRRTLATLLGMAGIIREFVFPSKRIFANS